MNSSVAALIVVSTLFVTAWERDVPAGTHDVRVASRAHIAPEVLAAARQSARLEAIAREGRAPRSLAAERRRAETARSRRAVNRHAATAQRRLQRSIRR